MHMRAKERRKVTESRSRTALAGMDEAAVLSHSLLSGCFTSRARQMRASVEVPREYVLLDVYSDAGEGYTHFQNIAI